MAGGALLEFHRDADGALFEDGIMVLKTGNTLNMLMGIVKVVITGMPETLMP
jgi:hypothetical protein